MRSHGRRRGTRRVLCTPLLCVAAITATGAMPAGAQAAIAVSDVQVTETNGTVGATFTITREAPALAPAVMIAFQTADIGALAPGDYTAVSGTRSFSASLLGGSQSQQVTVTVQGDLLDEPTETFVLRISGPEIGDGEGVATIADDDPAPAVSVADAAHVSEAGSGAVAVFAIGLAAPSGRDVSVAFATANGSATAGQDYTARGGTVTVPAGSTVVNLGVPLLDDAADEPAETFELRISSPSAGALARAAATATILDDDEPAAPPVGPPAATPVTPTGPPVAGSSGAGGASSSLPRLGMSAPRLRRSATVLVTVACPAGSGGCSGRLTLFSRPSARSKIKALRRERRLGRSTFKLAEGRSRTLEITLSKADRRLLNRAGRMSVRAYAVTQDASGATGVRTVNGTLIARTAHSR